MELEFSKTKVITSLFWKLLERVGTQGIQFLVQVILARLLFPKDYGILAIVVTFINIATVFIQSGFNTSLIQKKDTDENDYNSVFILGLIAAGVINVLFFFISPVVAKFYDEPQLTSILRVLSLTLFASAITSVQFAIISKKMLFKEQFLNTLLATVFSGIAGVFFAYMGFGVWSLVIQQLVSQVFVTLSLFRVLDWRPKFYFSIQKIKVLFSFGWKLLVSGLIDTTDKEIRGLLIGKLYSRDVLGFYNRGNQFPLLIVSNINGSIQSVLFPTLASQQDNREKVKSIMRRAIITSSFLIFPIMVGLSVVSEPLVRLLLTEKWLGIIPFLQIFCASYALWPIHTANLQAINAVGRSDISLKLEIIKKIIGLIILVSTAFYGVYVLALGTLATGIISSFINAYPNKRLLNYSYFEQIKDIFPYIVISVIMGCIVYPIKWLGLYDIITLLLQFFAGVFIYVILAKALNLECLDYLLGTLKELKINIKKNEE
ncbi:lipopolysaccharide biosynthesis protein [Acetivibrio clariflavus]|uniref:lipopolysaccharide biosynthesis protein n=1 Tax=Acetivibrio clariflavus TaxID=288965 RepID=UPI0031F5067B